MRRASQRFFCTQTVTDRLTYPNSRGMDKHIRIAKILFLISICGYALAAEARDMAIHKKSYSKDPAKLEQLDPLQYHVTQENGTERPFNNAYWDNHAKGIYVDVTTGEPLFSSVDKFDSGTGWPSFSKPIEGTDVVEKTDSSLLMKRTEVRSGSGDAHLGHVFDDGPKDKGGMRYCINSASLRFIPKDDLEKEGYGEYLSLFKN